MCTRAHLPASAELAAELRPVALLEAKSSQDVGYPLICVVPAALLFSRLLMWICQHGLIGSQSAARTRQQHQTDPVQAAASPAPWGCLHVHRPSAVSPLPGLIRHSAATHRSRRPLWLPPTQPRQQPAASCASEPPPTLDGLNRSRQSALDSPPVRIQSDVALHSCAQDSALIA